MKRVTVTGGTGFIGRRVVDALRARGDEVTVLSRGGTPGTVRWADPLAEPAAAEALAGRDGVVHLLGENVAQRWTDKAKRRIRESRELGTRNLVEGLSRLSEDERPAALVSMSAIGFYGARGDERVDEIGARGRRLPRRGRSRSGRRRPGRPRRSASAWRSRAPASCCAEGGGALDKMLPPFKLGVGGPVAGGRQYVPWVHLDDVVEALLFLLDGGSGAYNLTAPEPVTNKELSKALGRVLRRPAVAPVPALAVGRCTARWRGSSRRACARCRSGCSRRATPSSGRTSTTRFARRSADPARRSSPRRADDRLLGDPRQGVRGRAADVGVLPLLLRGAGPVAARPR